MDRLRRDGHRPHGLLVALMTDVEHGIALSRSDLQLVMDLGDQRAHGVNDRAARLLRRLDHFGG